MMFFGPWGLMGTLLVGIMIAVVRMNAPQPPPTRPVDRSMGGSMERPYSPSSTAVHHDMQHVQPVQPVQQEVKEHFVNGTNDKEVGVKGIEEPIGHASTLSQTAGTYSGPTLPEYTPPTARNLFMNILVDEYKYHPERPEAADVDHPAVKQAMDDFFRVQWFSDPTDVFGKNQNQRQFITQPSTTVPNQQGEFADWLYRIPGKTCKEGGRPACLAGTDGSAIPWLSHSS